jgi:hypothetical protein
VVALHARHPAIVISAEDAVIVGIAALLKPGISQALLRPGLPAIEIWRATESLATGPKPARHLPIGVRRAEPMSRVVRPHRTAEFSVEFTEAVAVEEGVVDE